MEISGKVSKKLLSTKHKLIDTKLIFAWNNHSCFCYRIKLLKKIIVTFYLTIQSFFLANVWIARYNLLIVRKSKECISHNSENCDKRSEL